MDRSKEEILIELVKQKNYLYDKTHKDYKDRQKKNNGFTEIGGVLEISGNDARKCWEELKKQYTSFLRKHKQPSGSAAWTAPEFRHSKIMSFYKDHYRPYKSYSNVNEFNGTDDSIKSAEDTNSLGEEINISDQVEYIDFENDAPPVVVQDLQENITPVAPVTTRIGRKRKSDTADDSEFEKRVVEALQTASEMPDEDAFDQFGTFVAGRIRKLHGLNKKLARKLEREIQRAIINFEEEASSNDEAYSDNEHIND